MKRKVFLSLFIICLIFTLIGCDVVNHKEEVKEVVNAYWLALSNKRYVLAKTYCVPYGDAYYAVEDYQILSGDDYVTINWTSYINWIKVIGNKATVDIKLILNVTVCFEDICSSQTETLYNYSMYLIKIDSDWKLN